MSGIKVYVPNRIKYRIGAHSDGNSDNFIIENDHLDANHDIDDGTVIELSGLSLYFIGAIICLLLILNMICLYANCQIKPRDRDGSYKKASQIASSDDDSEI